MNTLKRIKQYIDFKGITNSRFEKSIGYSNGAFSSQLKNNRSIGVDKVENILKIYTDLNPLWLLTGKGDMILQKQELHPINEDKASYKVNSEYNTIISKLDHLLEVMDHKFEGVEEKLKTIGLLTKIEDQKDKD